VLKKAKTDSRRMSAQYITTVFMFLITPGIKSGFIGDDCLEQKEPC